MFHTYCGGCSNRVDPAKAVIWKRPSDGRFLYFCSEECRRVGEEIEPEYACGFMPRREQVAVATKPESAVAKS